MKNYQFLLKQNLQDLNPITVGEAECPPGLKTHLDMRTSSVLHYVRKGCGKLQIKDQVYPVHQGQFFLVMIGEIATCISDSDDPWEYQWVGFTGTLSHDFAQLPPVFSLPEEIVERLYDIRQPEENMGMRLASDLMLLHSKLIHPKPRARDYVQQTITYVQTSYMHKLSVTQLAKELGVDRCHLSRVFKEKMHISIQDYILRFRISEAKRYLKYDYSIKETAMLCGFNDPPNFTRFFVREEGITPTQWKSIYVNKLVTDHPFGGDPS
ncbi:MAG: AraC family transcriptional regulator [Oscillospiraceae bacterium]|nr:AraC family transcriptional regulator [Oscillospiraceae bacterium]